MDKNDNPAAFPLQHQPALHTQTGMSLRDYFAGQALVGLLGESGCDVANEIASQEKTTPQKAVAEYAYKIADAMLEARK